MEEHRNAVRVISSQVRSFFERKVPFRIYHGSTNSTRQHKFDRAKMVDTSSLTNVLKVDEEAKTVLVQPNVPMDKLVQETLRKGLIPKVVMEFPGITVGGGFAGTSAESSSFKYGYFDRTITSFEIVLPHGSVITASADENSDIFYAAAGSFGTFGVTTLFEIQLVDATSHVQLTYHPVSGVEEALRKIQEAVQDDRNDYVDGILFSLDAGAIITGKLASIIDRDVTAQCFSRAQDPWFYLHAQKVVNDAMEPVKEAVPIQDYLFRYDRGAFWTGAYAFKYFMTPFNRITRWILDDFMHTRVMYHALHASGHAKQYIIQDLALPPHTAQEFIEYVDKDFGFYPLWLCPLKQSEHMSLHPRIAATGAGSSEMLINVGVWGPGPSNYDQFVAANRRIESKVRELGGLKWLYAQAYYTEDEFWSIYDRDWYSNLRLKYHATYLPNVYDKVKVDLSEEHEKARTWQQWLRGKLWSTWPVSGVYGVLQTLISREYLLAR